MSELSHIDDRIIDYVYGELAARDANGVERHIADCARCREEVNKLQGVRRVALALPKLMPAPHVTETILRRGRELAPGEAARTGLERKRWSLASFLFRPAFAGAFLFAIVLGVGLYITQSDDRMRLREEPAGVARFAPADLSRPSLPAPAAPAPSVAAAPGATHGRGAALAQAEASPPPVGAKANDEARWTKKSIAPVGSTSASGATKYRALAEPRIIARVARPTPESLFPEASSGLAARSGSLGSKAALEEENKGPSGPTVVARGDIADTRARKAKRAESTDRDALGVGFAGAGGEGQADKHAPKPTIVATATPAPSADPNVRPSSPSRDQGLPDPPSDARIIGRATTRGPGTVSGATGNVYDVLARQPPTAPAPATGDQMSQLAAKSPAPAQSSPPMQAAMPASVPSEPSAAPPARQEYLMQANAPAAAMPQRTLSERAGAEDDRANLKKESAQAMRVAEPSTNGRARAEVLLAKAEGEHARGDLRAAIATLEQLIRTNPGYATPRAFELLATSYERLGENVRAAEVRAQARRELRRSSPVPAAKAK